MQLLSNNLLLSGLLLLDVLPCLYLLICGDGRVLVHGESQFGLQCLDFGLDLLLHLGVDHFLVLLLILLLFSLLVVLDVLHVGVFLFVLLVGLFFGGHGLLDRDLLLDLVLLEGDNVSHFEDALVVDLEVDLGLALFLVVDLAPLGFDVLLEEEVVPNGEEGVALALAGFQHEVAFLQQGHRLLGGLVGTQFDHVLDLVGGLHVEEFDLVWEAVLEFGRLHRVEWRDHSGHDGGSLADAFVEV